MGFNIPQERRDDGEGISVCGDAGLERRSRRGQIGRELRVVAHGARQGLKSLLSVDGARPTIELCRLTCVLLAGSHTKNLSAWTVFRSLVGSVMIHVGFLFHLQFRFEEHEEHVVLVLGHQVDVPERRRLAECGLAHLVECLHGVSR